MSLVQCHEGKVVQQGFGVQCSHHCTTRQFHVYEYISHMSTEPDNLTKVQYKQTKGNILLLLSLLTNLSKTLQDLSPQTSKQKIQ